MANSPLLFNNTILLPIGGRGQAIGAFNPETGALLWKAGDVDYSPASPILIDVDGQQQLVVFGGDRIVGLDPANGTRAVEPSAPAPTGASTSARRCGRRPITCCCSRPPTAPAAARSSCARPRGKTTVTERWAVNRVRVHIGSIIRVGDTAYMSSGDFGPAFLTAVNVKTGAIAWQDRAFARAQLLYADGKLIVLDEDGTLATRHRVAAGPQGAGARADSREPRVDAADAGRQDPLRARSQDHCGLRPQLNLRRNRSRYFESIRGLRSPRHGVRWPG